MRYYVKEDVKNLKAYVADNSRPPVMLDANESPFDISKEIIDKIKSSAFSSSLNRYPDSRAEKLCRKLADYIGNEITWDMVLTGDGSDELIGIVISSIVKKGGRVLLPVPGFSMYSIYSLINEADIVEFKRGEDFKLDADELIKTANKENVSLVMLVNPNNPTGTLTPKEDLVKLAKNLNCALLIDEAYYEFSKQTAVDLVNRFDNVIILRTLSKAWGLAGLRLGYLISNKYMVNELLKVKPPFNVNTLTQQISCDMLDYKNIMESRVNFILTERERLYDELKKIEGFKLFETHANFIFVKVPDADYLTKKLREMGIAIRNFNQNPETSNCVRITVGTVQENNRLIEQIKKIAGV